MVREKVRVATWTLRWKCAELRADSKRHYYGRFILSPLKKATKSFAGGNRRSIHHLSKIWKHTT